MLFPDTAHYISSVNHVDIKQRNVNMVTTSVLLLGTLMLFLQLTAAASHLPLHSVMLWLKFSCVTPTARLKQLHASKSNS